MFLIMLRDYDMQIDINICKEIYFIVLHIVMEIDIKLLKEIYFIVLHICMQGDVNCCIKR